MSFDWFGRRYSTLVESITIGRVLALPLIFGAVTGAINLAPVISKHGAGAILLGTPGWAWGLIAALGLIIYYVFGYAHRLRISIEPQIQLSFDEIGIGIVQAIDQISVPLPGTYNLTVGGQGIETIVEYKSTYVRVTANVLSRRIAQNCSAYITRLEKSINHGATFSVVPMPQPVLLGSGRFDVIPNIPTMIDFAKSSESDAHLVPTGYWPLVLRDVFQDQATYRFDIAVSDGDGRTSDILVDVIWAGKFDTITAKKATRS